MQHPEHPALPWKHSRSTHVFPVVVALPGPAARVSLDGWSRRKVVVKERFWRGFGDPLT